jgi:hypothetical protein
MPGALGADPSQLLDLDVDQLTRTLTFIPLGRLKAQATELAHPVPRQDPRDSRERHLEHVGDLWAVNRNRRSAAITSTV